MAVSKRTRYEVLKRDNHTCRYCGASAPDVKLTVDHVTPVALGGSDAPDNLVAACRDCNAGKASTSPDAPLVADVEQKAMEWGAAITRFNQIRSQERQMRDEYVYDFEHKWHSWRWGKHGDNDGEVFPRPPDWRSTIWQFYGVGLPIEELEDAVEIACGHRNVPIDNAWRYMCGVVWRKVEQMHDGARALLEAPDGP